LNGDENVRAQTRQRVMDVVQEYHFQPNLAARGLAAGRTGVFGLVIPTGVGAMFTDPFFPLLVQGAVAGCSPRDFSLMLWPVDPHIEQRTIRKILYNGLVDGVIVSSFLLDDPLVDALAHSHLPYVLVGGYPASQNASCVDVENAQGGRLAVLHLAGNGRKRIAAITGPQGTFVGKERYRGYVQGLAEAGLGLEPDWVAEGNFSEESGYTAMQVFLQCEKDSKCGRPDAVFAASDAMAEGAQRAIQEAGLRVPEDVALVGFDDLPTSSRSTPPLTTIRQPIMQEGKAAAEMLIDLLEHPEDGPQKLIFPVELVVRESSGPIDLSLLSKDEPGSMTHHR
jgi:LacI family transcriptional regulator